MNRRTALFWTMLLGGIVPRSLLAQTPNRRLSSRDIEEPEEPTPGRRGRAEGTSGEPQAQAADDAPPDIPPEAGQQWKNFDIRKYTSLAHSQNNPQNAIIEWIFRRTTSAPWHGDKIAVLSASRTQIRAYQNAKVLEQVGEVVERFIDATNDLLSVRVRFVAAVDTAGGTPSTRG